MKRLERFQNNNYNSGNESLNSAHSGESLNIISNNSVFDLGENTTLEEDTASNNTGTSGNDFHQHIELEDAKFDFNIWDLLGVKSLGEDKHNCPAFDCAIKSTHSLEKCNNTTVIDPKLSSFIPKLIVKWHHTKKPFNENRSKIDKKNHLFL